MGIFRYGSQEAKNIAKAKGTAEQQAKFDAFLAARKAAVAITKESLGLGNVNNTSDADKPVSTATLAALNGKEPTILPGTISQYWRGDKSWQTLDKAAVGLSSVDNTSDLAKPISTATQTALNGKAAIGVIATIAANANATVTPTATAYQVFHTGTLTADRTLTLTTAGMTTGSVIRFTRTGTGAFNLIIGGLKNLATNTWCDVVFNGSAWVLTAYGSL